jgi:hypothetical protein
MKNFYLAFLVGRSPRRPPSRSSGVSQKRSAIAARFIVVGLLVVFFPSCAGGRQYRSIPGEGPPRTPRHLQLDRPISVATLHFPAGIYSLQSEDKAGYYYAAPRPIVQHTALGSVFRKGGIYVNKRDPRKLRGYVYWAGALTHIGNFSKAKHEFR